MSMHLDTPTAVRAPEITYGGPERLFGVEDIAVDGGIARAQMRLGARLRDGEHVPGAALAVLVDDVLGYAAVAVDPQERWSVSTDIALDIVSSLPADGVVRAEARALSVNASGSVTTCIVVDEEDRVVAHGLQRGRWVSMDGVDGGELEESAESDEREVAGIRALLGLCAAPSGLAAAALELRPSAMTRNRLGVLHGGIALCVSQLVAQDALASVGAGGLTRSSIRIAFTRPITPDATINFTAQRRHAGRSFAVLDVVGSAGGKDGTMAQVTAHPAI
jgi:acyl-coenzyme A thioesterase PaaI-like protein